MKATRTPTRTLDGHERACARCGLIRAVDPRRVNPSGMCRSCISVTKDETFLALYDARTPITRAARTAGLRTEYATALVALIADDA